MSQQPETPAFYIPSAEKLTALGFQCSYYEKGQKLGDWVQKHNEWHWTRGPKGQEKSLLISSEHPTQVAILGDDGWEEAWAWLTLPSEAFFDQLLIAAGI